MIIKITMQNLIEQLKSFNERIQAIDDYSDEDMDNNLIGIKFYRFIQDNPILKEEFNKRAKYFKNLSTDEDFTKIQEAMINIIWERAVFLKDKGKELDSIQKKYQNKKILILKNAGDNVAFLTIPEHIALMQDKKNYYRLGDKIFAPMDAETSQLINVTGLKWQFKDLPELISVIYFNTKKQKIKKELDKKDKEYNDLYRQLEEKLDNKPIEIDHKSFEEVYIFALCTTPHKGYEYLYHNERHQYHQYGHKRRFYNIKKYCKDVIRDLTFYLQGLKENEPTQTEQIHKVEVVRGKIEVDGLRDGLQAIAEKDDEDTIIIKNKKRIQLPHFPRRTPWKDVTLRFLDGRGVIIETVEEIGGKRVKEKNVPADYKSLGFSDDKGNKPNLAWVFLLGMAKNNGETEPIPSPVPDNIKQIKRQISNFLKTLFKNDTEPFYDFSETNTYKLKITLIAPQTDDVHGEKKEDQFGVQEYLKETMVSECEPQNNDDENDW